MRRSIVWLVAGWVGTGCGLLGAETSPPAPEREGLALAGILLFDGQNFSEDQTVVVQGGVITLVGSSKDVELPPDITRVSGEGMTLLPGFIDSHVHLGFYAPNQVLRGGIVTCRDLGWPLAEVEAQARLLRQDPTLGPDLIYAGAMLTYTDGYPSHAGWAPPGTAREVHNAEDARLAVQEQLQHGATVIKVAQEPHAGPTLPRELLCAITDEAHRRGARVTSHLGSVAELSLALECQVDELAHGLWSNEVIPPDILTRMVGQGMVVIPTLHVDGSAQRLANTRAFVEAGGQLIYGTDMGNSGPPPGIDPEELSRMEQVGLSRMEVLRAATSEAAIHLGLMDRGRIVPGARADLVVVTGDPRDNWEVLAQPDLILHLGRVVQ